MSNEELIRKVMEHGHLSKEDTDKMYQEAIEGVAFTATVINAEREEERKRAVDDSSEFCNNCCALRLIHDPNLYYWFEDNYMKAVCLERRAVIEGLLGAWEITKIQKPIYCPNFGRKLTEKEKDEIEIQLKWAQERWEKEV